MTGTAHRERVIAALNHQEPDRVPLDFGTGTSSTTVPEAHDRLLRHLKIERPKRLMPSALRLSFVNEEILRSLDIDTRPVFMEPSSRPMRICDEPGAFYDDFGVKWRQVSYGTGSYAEMIESPLAEATIDDLDTYPYWPDVLDPARYSGLETRVKDLFYNSDYAIIAMPSFNSSTQHPIRCPPREYCGHVYARQGSRTISD